MDLGRLKEQQRRAGSAFCSESKKKLRFDLEPGTKLFGMFNRDRAFTRQNPSGNRMIDTKDFPEFPGRDAVFLDQIPQHFKRIGR